MRRADDGDERIAPDLPSVIDTIGIGFSQLIRRPLVILIPVAVDIFLWLGWKLNAGELAERAGGWTRSIIPGSNRLAEAIEGQTGWNIVELASMRLPTLRLPTFVPLLVTAESVRYDQWDPSIDRVTWWILLLAAIGLLIVGMVIGAEFLRGIVAVVTEQPYIANLAETLSLAYKLSLWSILAVALLALVILPIIAIQIALQVIGVGYSSFLVLLAVIPAGIGFIYFFFSVYAIAIDRLPPMPAFRMSYQLVRQHARQSLGLILAFLLVTGGFPFLWRMMVGHPAGTLLAMIGNAFIASGMIAAACVFYRDRAHLVAQTTERY